MSIEAKGALASLDTEILSWLLGSLCGLYHRPFDAALVAGQYPPPTTRVTFHTVARALGLKTGTASLPTTTHWQALPLPCIAFLKPQPEHDPADPAATIPLLILKTDGTKLLYFRPGSQTAEILSTAAAGECLERS